MKNLGEHQFESFTALKTARNPEKYISQRKIAFAFGF